MIGVAVKETDRGAAMEFFELFKTPWEFCRQDRQYEVVVCASEEFPCEGSILNLIYCGESANFDADNKVAVRPRCGGTLVTDRGIRIPIFGSTITFPEKPYSLLKEETTQE